jgi:hypothetical protein
MSECRDLESSVIQNSDSPFYSCPAHYSAVVFNLGYAKTSYGICKIENEIISA